MAFSIRGAHINNRVSCSQLVLHMRASKSRGPISMIRCTISMLHSRLRRFLVDARVPFGRVSTIPIRRDIPRSSDARQTSLTSVPISFLLGPVSRLRLSIHTRGYLVGTKVGQIVSLMGLSRSRKLGVGGFKHGSLARMGRDVGTFNLSFNVGVGRGSLRGVLGSTRVSR